MDTGADSSLPSSQESVGTLFSNNLPAGCFKALLSNNDNDGDDDFGLAAAEAEAKESGSVTPLVKQELKWLVQSRRLAQGKQELRVEEEEPSPQQVGFVLGGLSNPRICSKVGWPSLSLSFSLAHARALSLSLSLTHTHTHTDTLSRSNDRFALNRENPSFFPVTFHHQSTIARSRNVTSYTMAERSHNYASLANTKRPS